MKHGIGPKSPQFCDKSKPRRNCRPSCLTCRWSRALWSQSGLDFSINVAVFDVAKGANQWGCEHCKTLPLIDWLIINDVLWLCDGVCSESREALPKFQKRQVIGKKSRKGLERRGVSLGSRQESDLPAKWKQEVKTYYPSTPRTSPFTFRLETKKWCARESVTEMGDETLLRWIRDEHLDEDANKGLKGLCGSSGADYTFVLWAIFLFVGYRMLGEYSLQ